MQIFALNSCPKLKRDSNNLEAFLFCDLTVQKEKKCIILDTFTFLP